VKVEAVAAPAAAPVVDGGGGKRLNPIKLRQMKERRSSIEDEVTKLEAEIADYEAELSNFVNVEETARVTGLLNARRADLEALMNEWEEVANTIEANT
jgi:ATP-binding cassette, subfamily F, member 3